MRESPNRRAVIVGLFVFVGLIFLISGILMVGNLHEPFKKKMVIVSFFEDVNGLQTGNNIWLSGVKVGTVKEILFYSRSSVEVRMSVDVKAQGYIRKDAKVKLSTDGFIGNKIVVIYGGSEMVAAVQEGDTLEVEKSVSQVDMLKVLQESNKNLKSMTNDLRIISKRMVSGEGSMGKLLNDNSLYNNVNLAIQSIQQTSSNAQKFLLNLNRYAAQLNQEGTLANDLATDTVVFNSISGIVQQIKQIADTTLLIVTQLKAISSDSTTAIGMLMHDKAEGARLKLILKNLESSSKNLDIDLKAAQFSFLLRKGIKKQKQE
ncbi:MCE family protein [Chryseotalea sanaruensis]|uniref:MCE family protein n=1 Tax=Chryseotalea sanaruensis TaxID=2482724 RepID=A0A401U667_9BACT|nr:MlaD family protein [Chryseotalea sanaruensis]GCC50369.1 MCE family protein [Chryseotalea sanaruensis]